MNIQQKEYSNSWCLPSLFTPQTTQVKFVNAPNSACRWAFSHNGKWKGDRSILLDGFSPNHSPLGKYLKRINKVQEEGENVIKVEVIMYFKVTDW